MWKETSEEINIGASSQSSLEKLEITNKALLKKIGNLEVDLFNVEDDLKNEQGIVKSLEKELNSSQNYLSIIQGIFDKLKKRSPEFYDISVGVKNDIEQILYEAIIPDKPKK